MVNGPVADAGQAFEYDVQLSRRPDDALRELYPDMTVLSTEPQTALRRRVEGPEELSALLVDIGAVGLTLTDVHRVTTTEDVYEVRVVGELGGPLLRYLRCAHYTVQEQTLVRLTLVAGELHRFLQACADCGAGLERVRRVGDPSLVGTG
jgi:hypothetical protein